MTEIPEHLLKRAAERRAAMTGGGDAAGAAPAADAPAADAGAAAPSAAVAKKEKAQAPLPTLDNEPTPAKPDIPVVAAAKNRKRVPFWAAPILALLPLWAFIYVYAVQPPPAGENDPLVIGKAVYTANCASCHGATGAGATEGLTGQQLSDGHVLKTFSDPLAMAHWIEFGAEGGARADGTYGDKDRPGGAMNTSTLPGVMPAFSGTLDPEELAAVVIYVRDEISGADPTADKSFNAETFAADPAAVAAQITAVVEAGPGGDPDLKAAEPAG
ncbi:cytochrome c [Aquihabitans sp. G128]|uniref:c-type cytochrome n=1 Tax=Aquihabitans sp. G128 TaxID=2849779 RepID=UPI001C248322|nr:cytochrome c [Aquihabitans sp. G128]QXC60161.1 cytochrome c [Aquihabitans sp. G128]